MVVAPPIQCIGGCGEGVTADPGLSLRAGMQHHACWLVQLLGIGCVDKFAGGNIAQFVKMNYYKVTIL